MNDKLLLTSVTAAQPPYSNKKVRKSQNILTFPYFFVSLPKFLYTVYETKNYRHTC